MDSVNIPSYKILDCEPSVVKIKNKNCLFINAQLTCKCNRDELSNLIGTTLNNNIIIGVDSFCVYNQDFRYIGLLIEKDKHVKT